MRFIWEFEGPRRVESVLQKDKERGPALRTSRRLQSWGSSCMMGWRGQRGEVRRPPAPGDTCNLSEVTLPTCMCAHVHTCAHTRTCTDVHTCEHMRVQTQRHMCTCVYVCVCVHTCENSQRHVHIHTHNTHVHAHRLTEAQEHMYTHTCTHLRTDSQRHMHTCTYTHTCTHMHIGSCTHVCIYPHVHTHELGARSFAQKANHKVLKRYSFTGLE